MVAFPGLFRTMPDAAPRAARLSRGIVAAWTMAFAFLALLAVGWLHGKGTVERHLREHAVAVAQLAAERLSQTLDDADRSLIAVIADLRLAGIDLEQQGRRGENVPLQALLERGRAHHAALASLILADADGNVLARTPSLDAAFVADRHNLLVALRQNSQDVSVISAASATADAGNALIGRRIRGADGRSLGVLVARIELDASFARLFGARALDSQDIIGFHGSVGYLHSPEDGLDRLTVVRKLPRYPFEVIYAKNVTDVAAGWKYELLVLAAAAFLSLAGTAAVTVGIRRRMTLTAQLQDARRELEERNHALHGALVATAALAAIDQLTGLFNRRSFDQRLQEAIARIERHDGALSLLMIDTDHFKSINDRHGHIVGDEVLKHLARVLSERLRQNDVLARWGGEEFVVLADSTSLDNGIHLAEQIRESIERAEFPGQGKITVSIGITEYRRGETAQELITRADGALYEAKRTGRNKVVAVP